MRWINFSPVEATKITGVEQLTLRTWRTRGFLPGYDDKEFYSGVSPRELIQLHIIRMMAEELTTALRVASEIADIVSLVVLRHALNLPHVVAVQGTSLKAGSLDLISTGITSRFALGSPHEDGPKTGGHKSAMKVIFTSDLDRSAGKLMGFYILDLKTIARKLVEKTDKPWVHI